MIFDSDFDGMTLTGLCNLSSLLPICSNLLLISVIILLLKVTNKNVNKFFGFRVPVGSHRLNGGGDWWGRPDMSECICGSVLTGLDQTPEEDL